MTTYVITGAGGGIGAALARQVAAGGVLLSLVDRGPRADLDAVADDCRNAGADVLTATFDVCDERAIAGVIDDAASRHDRLDFVYANAGVIHQQGDDGLSTATARELMETNYHGAVNTLAPAAAIMRTQGNGTLVAITSISALVATHGSAAYSASKAALTMWTDSLRLSLGDTDVRVTNIVLGFVDTPMTHGLSHAERLWIDVDVAAAAIIKAARAGTAIASIPSLKNTPWWLMREAPYAVRRRLLERAHRYFN